EEDEAPVPGNRVPPQVRQQRPPQHRLHQKQQRRAEKEGEAEQKRRPHGGEGGHANKVRVSRWMGQAKSHPSSFVRGPSSVPRQSILARSVNEGRRIPR